MPCGCGTNISIKWHPGARKAEVLVVQAGVRNRPPNCQCLGVQPSWCMHKCCVLCLLQCCLKLPVIVQALRHGTARAPSVQLAGAHTSCRHTSCRPLCLCTHCCAPASCTAVQQMKHAQNSWCLANTGLYPLPGGRRLGQCPGSSLTVNMFSWYTCSTAMECISKCPLGRPAVREPHVGTRQL